MRLQSKKPVVVKNKTIGGSTPQICLPLVAKDNDELLAQVSDLLPLEPDLLEWRIDAYQQVEDTQACVALLKTLRKTIGSIPMIFTCRIDREGGMQSISQENRLNLISACIKTGLIDIVDIELCNETPFIEKVLEVSKENDTKTILSYHDFEKTPGKDLILNKLSEQQAMGADIAKVAVMPETYEDVLTLLDVTLKARTQTLEIPVVTMAMGEEGVVTRLAGGIFGSDITFAIGKNASAPGQIPIGDLRKAMSVLY